MATRTIPPLVLTDPTDDPELYELLDGRWLKKESVGHIRHSRMCRILFDLLLPFCKRYGLAVEREWTVIRDGKKIIPDVTVSYPQPQPQEGYLVAPAFLAVETKLPGQRLQKLINKCLIDHHSMGTPYCWILDIEEELGYECHCETGKAIVVPVLTLGNCQWPINLPVKTIFNAFAKAR